MMEFLKSLKFLIGFGIMIAFGAWWVIGLAADTGELKAKVSEMEKTFRSIKDIAEQVKTNQKAIYDPKEWLRKYLLIKNEDEKAVSLWLSYPIGHNAISVQKDSLILPLKNVLFLSDLEEHLPELGLLRKFNDSGKVENVVILWDHRKKESP